jgi:hypothetical protein
MLSELQMLDVVVNNSLFKDHLKQLHGAWLLEGDYALAPAGRFKKPSVIFVIGLLWHGSAAH